MLIPLGILASSGGAAGSYELISTSVVGSAGESSVIFSNLGDYSTTYQHLQIRATTRNNAADTAYWLGIQFNSDTGSNYFWHTLTGTGSAVQSGSATSQSYIAAGESVSAQIASSIFSSHVIDILDPYETTKNTTVRNLSGQTGSRNRIWLTSGAWNSTSAISSIKLYLPQSANFVQYSRFSLYGLKGA